MGMQAYYQHISPEQLEALEASPEYAAPLVDSLTFHGHPGPAIIEQGPNPTPLFAIIALFVFVWFAWGRQVKDSLRRRVLCWGLSVSCLGVLCGTYVMQSNRQHRNFLILKSLE